MHAEKEASWVDDVIDQRKILPHYQPIVEAPKGEVPAIVGHEMLSRGRQDDGSLIAPFHLLEAARKRDRLFALDRAYRITCVEHAGRIKDQLIYINFIPTAIYVPEHCLATTIHYIKKQNIRPENVVFEVVESDEVKNIEHLKSILNYYKQHGFQYALDDVGTGVNGLEKLAYLEPNIVKLAREYVDGGQRTRLSSTWPDLSCRWRARLAPGHWPKGWKEKRT
ncbi:EAL domain-containing protein [Marinococcus sp. PL1-022]|uniref:EAL domain-containing protein n=1 Tax=Marinococcus sp. PL1-022 TaxID=3095363 RepID=UPI0029C24DC7|nr:EAL domain-containing protein [Marinococcus sp. PL1-022]MDX6152657.1 EAL domain-containing protein [Marinococcus sp. PL1-022]